MDQEEFRQMEEAYYRQCAEELERSRQRNWRGAGGEARLLKETMKAQLEQINKIIETSKEINRRLGRAGEVLREE